VLGCSTGEEAYSLAIALTECAELMSVSPSLQVFASDLNAASLRSARSGVYPYEVVHDVSPARLARFFTDVDGHCRVVKSIRDLCVFSHHNALTDPPFSRMDFVSCRNLLIYLEPELQHEVLTSLHYALVPGGVLWLWSADTIGRHQDIIETRDLTHRMFRRRPGTTDLSSRRPPSADFPSAESYTSPLVSPLLDLVQESARVLLARFAPAGVLVSATMVILQFRGDNGPFIAPAAG